MTVGIVHAVFEETAEAVERRFAGAPPEAAFVEIRADRLRAAEVAGLVRRAPRPVIVAARTGEDGGAFDGSTEERRSILRAALDAGAAFADVEWNGPLRDLALGLDAPRVLLSHHGARCETAALAPLLAEMAETKAGRLKIVPKATRAAQIAAVRDMLARAKGRTPALAAFATGATAVASRVLALRWGSWATYGAADRARRTGDGQPETRELIEVYRVHEIGEATRLFALFGAPLGRSPSPSLHAAGYRSLGLDAVYLPVETESLDEVEAIVGPEALGAEAFGLTIPLKEPAASRCATLDEYASCGAVNTVRAEGGRWQGFNTDAPAALALVRRHVEIANAQAAVVGAGGTGRAIAAALAAAGARVTIYNRSAARGREAARAAKAGFSPLGSLAEASWDLLVQATPLGRDGEDLLAPRRLTGRMVLDAAYGPEPTPLVRAARKRGLAVADGYDLLLGQALLQFERMTGEPPPERAIAAALDPWRPLASA